MEKRSIEGGLVQGISDGSLQETYGARKGEEHLEVSVRVEGVPGLGFRYHSRGYIQAGIKLLYGSI